MSTRTSRPRGSRTRSRMGLRDFDDRILLTDTHAWAYYRIPSVSYEFTTQRSGKRWRRASPWRWLRSG